MLKLALYGLGHWGERLITSVNGKSDRVSFIAGCSRFPDRHRAFAERHQVKIMSFEDALACNEIQGVVLATPHSQHGAQVKLAAAAGKHVFVEKPFTLTLRDAHEALEACKNAGVTLAHGYNRRFAPSYKVMRDMIRRGDIGTLLHIEGQHTGPTGLVLSQDSWRADPEECPAGALTARGVHPLDLMIDLAGAVAHVFAQSDHRIIKASVDDVTTALLRFCGGATGYLATHQATAEIWRLQAYGSEGWLEMRSETELVAADLAGVRTIHRFEPVDKERAELECFADMVAGGSYPVSNDQVLASIAVIEAVVKSIERKALVQLAA